MPMSHEDSYKEIPDPAPSDAGQFYGQRMQIEDRQTAHICMQEGSELLQDRHRCGGMPFAKGKYPLAGSGSKS